MNRKHLSIILTSILVGFSILISCAGNGTDVENPVTGKSATGFTSEWPGIDLNDLAEGSEIRASGLQLIEKPAGLVELTHGDARNDSVLIIAVHGYQSSGYEWVTGLKNLGIRYGSLFFFRYDWERCPADIASELAALIIETEKKSNYERVLVYGHSYGGLVVTQLASRLGKLDTEVHVIAAPLAGFPGLTDNCGPLNYPSWTSSVKVIQHRTVQAQDGAFRELDYDPQEIDLPFEEVNLLPPTMDGHRLGHNWSVTWVLDQHAGKAHRL